MARDLLAAAHPPDALLWEDEGAEQEGLFAGLDPPRNKGQLTGSTAPLKIPRSFMDLAALVACHRAPERWALLYKVAWRLTHGGERQLIVRL